MFESSKVAVILAARYNSSRLLGKAMLPLAGEDSMLSLIIKRLRTAQTVDDVIVATTSASYEHFKPVLDGLKCSFYIGSEQDVLSRYTETAIKFGVKTVVRATGDNPLVSIKALDLIVKHHQMTNADLSHFDLLPHGSGVEVIETSALEYANLHSVDAFEREHITQYHYRNDAKFKIEFPKAPDEFAMPELITTVDTNEQYEDVKNIFKYYHNNIFVDIDLIIKNRLYSK